MYTTNFTKRAGKFYTPTGIEVTEDMLQVNEHFISTDGRQGWIKTLIRLDPPMTLPIYQFIARIKGTRRIKLKVYEVQVSDPKKRFAAAELLLQKLQVTNVLSIEFINS